MSIKVQLLFALLFYIFGCSSDPEPFNFNKSELERLLASDSAKTWILTERTINRGSNSLDHCEQDDQVIFLRSQSVEDTTTLLKLTGPILCPSQTDTIIYYGLWMVMDGATHDSLQWVIDGDTTFRTIELISSQQLTLTLIEGPDLTSETYFSRP